MTDPATVKRELARLARGEPPDEAVVVRRAEAAVGDLDRAVAFASGGGLVRLERAVAAAERAGDDDLAGRGRRALAAFERFEAACAAGEPAATAGADDGR